MGDDTPQDTLTVFQQAGQADDYVEDATSATPAIPPRAAVKPRAGRPVRSPGVQRGTPVIPPTPVTPPAPPDIDPAPPVRPARTPATPPTAVTPAAAASDSTPPSAPAPVPVGMLEHAAAARALFASPAVALDTARPTRASTGLRGALARLGFPISPSSTEIAAWERTVERVRNETCVRQATWTRAVSVLIANPKGGTGKTPVALLLGGTLAAIRGGSVAVVEVADDPGALAYRAEGTPTLGIGELVRDAAQISNAGQLAGYTAPQTSFAAVIGSTGRRARLDSAAVHAAAAVIDEYYGIRVMDSGNQPTSSAFTGALEKTDVLAVPLMNAGDSVLEAIQLLDELRAQGGHAAHLADHAIAIRITDGRPEQAAVRDEVTRLLNAAGVEDMHEIPYDPHIAERGQLTLAALQSATRDAFTAAAATVVATLQTTARPVQKA